VKLLFAAGPQSAEEKTLMADAIDLLKKYYEKKVGPGDLAIAAHCPPAIARLLGRDSDKSAEFKELFAKDLEGKNKDRNANEIGQSCALALGQMVKPWDDEKAKDKDAEYCKILLDQAKTNKDAQTKYFCWLALGQIGGKASHDVLVKEFDNSKSLTRAWIAIAMGVQAFEKNDRLRKENSMPEPDPAFGPALKGALDEKNEQVLSAVAVALGLMQYKDTADAVRALLVKNSSRDELAGYLCIGLALMDDKHSMEDIKAIVAKSIRRPELLKQAAIALGKLGDKTIADELQKLLKEGEPNLAKLSAVASALGFIGDRRTIEPLKGMLFDTQLTELSRAFAAVALGGVADKEKLPWNSKIGVNLNYRAAVETLTDRQSGILDIL
jgi:HEAT repeat protein